MRSSPTSDLTAARVSRALRDPYAVALAVLAGVFAAVAQWPMAIVVLAVALVLAARVVAEFAIPRGARLEQADEIAVQEAQVRAALAAVEAAARVAPNEVVERVAKVAATVRDITARQAVLGAGSKQLFAVLRTATDYLPTAIDAYVKLPHGYATTRRLTDGRTPLEVLIGQLDLLEKEMIDIADAVTKNDLDRLLAHGRFLSERFGRSTLRLPEPAQPR